MTLKFRVDSLDDVDESQRSLYTEKDGAFVLQVDGLEGVEDTEALRNAKQHEKQARLKAEADLKSLREEFDGLRAELEKKSDEGHKKAGDIEALEKSYQAKIDKIIAEKDQKIEALSGNLKTVLVDNEAHRLANKLAVEGSADVLLPHIKSRLTMEERDGKQTTVVLDSDGKPSATSIDELEAEIRGMKSFAPVLSGSKASGGGAGGESGGGGASGKKIDLAKADVKDRVQAIREKVEAGS